MNYENESIRLVDALIQKMKDDITRRSYKGAWDLREDRSVWNPWPTPKVWEKTEGNYTVDIDQGVPGGDVSKE